MQLVIIYTVQSSAFELLRIVPLILAALRSFIAKDLTEKDKKKAVAGILRPLSDPPCFTHIIVAAQLVLFFTILLVYAVMYPLAPLILAICFLLWGVSFSLILVLFA